MTNKTRTRTNDQELRELIHKQVLRREHADPQIRVIDELGLHHGSSRADIAVISSSLRAYEIKSDSDSLTRLELQAQAYNSIFCRVTLVCAPRHTKTALKEIPEWWGVISYRVGPRGGLRLERIRTPRPNPQTQPLAIAKLLWREEARTILERRGIAPPSKRTPRGILYEQIAAALSKSAIRREVARQLATRSNWRNQQQPSPDDDSYQHNAK